MHYTVIWEDGGVCVEGCAPTEDAKSKRAATQWASIFPYWWGLGASELFVGSRLQLPPSDDHLPFSLALASS